MNPEAKLIITALKTAQYVKDVAGNKELGGLLEDAAMETIDKACDLAYPEPIAVTAVQFDAMEPETEKAAAYKN